MTDWQRIAEDNLRAYEASEERVRVLTERLTAAEMLIGSLPNETYDEVKRLALAALRGVLDEPGER